MEKNGLSEDMREKLSERYNNLRQQLEIDPKSVDFLVRLGNTCLELSYRQEAVIYYQRVLEIDPGMTFAIRKLKENFTPGELKDVKFPEPILPFWKNIFAIAQYPLRGRGMGILIGGGIFFGVFFGFIVKLSPLAGLIIGPLTAGFLSAYMIEIIKIASDGGKEPPDWPDIANFSSIFRSLFQVAMAGIIPFLPGILLLIFARELASLAIILLFLGIIYYPMALVIVALYNNAAAAMNFVLIWKSIWKIKKDYFFALLTLFVFIVIRIFVLRLSILVPKILFLPNFIAWFCTLYFLMVQMYILGNLYYINRHKLNWFD